MLHLKMMMEKAKHFPTSAQDIKHKVKSENVQSYSLMNKLYLCVDDSILDFVSTTVKKMSSVFKALRKLET